MTVAGPELNDLRYFTAAGDGHWEVTGEGGNGGEQQYAMSICDWYKVVKSRLQLAQNRLKNWLMTG